MTLSPIPLAGSIRARRDLGGVQHRAEAGGHAATDVVFADLGDAICGNTVKFEKVEQPLEWLIGSLSWLERVEPPGIRPLPCVARIAVMQRLALPLRQLLQLATFRRVEGIT